MAADRFAAQAHAIETGADDARRALEALASEADASVTQLEPVVMDAANAAVLLRGVLETQYEKNARENAKALCGLGEGEDMVMISVNDKKMKHTMRVQVVFR